MMLNLFWFNHNKINNETKLNLDKLTMDKLTLAKLIKILN
jgi:hypothetical protein